MPFEQVQFVLIMVHAFQLLFIDCNYPRAFVWWIGMHAVMFFFLFNEFYKSTYKYKQSMRLALEKKIKAMEQEALANGIKSNGTTATTTTATTTNGVNGVNGVNGSLNQYYDSVNHNDINNKKNIEYTENYYGNGNANGTTELINRKK